MDERTLRQVRAAAADADVSVSEWLTQAAREKLQRDGAVVVSELDQATGGAWTEWD